MTGVEMRLSTKSYPALGHREITFNYDETHIPDVHAKWFLRFLEDEVASGARYLPGQTLQVGWSITLIKEHPDGALGVFEADMKSMPMNFVDSVTNTLIDLRSQKYVLDSLGFEIPEFFPSMRQSGVVCDNLSSSALFSIFRADPQRGHDSGWSICCDDSDHNHNDPQVLSCVSLYEIGCRYPSLIQYLALPAGIAIYGAGGNAPAIYLHEEERRPSEGSYLARLWARE